MLGVKLIANNSGSNESLHAMQVIAADDYSSMTSVVDLGLAATIHPPNKFGVARRLVPLSHLVPDPPPFSFQRASCLPREITHLCYCVRTDDRVFTTFRSSKRGSVEGAGSQHRSQRPAAGRSPSHGGGIGAHLLISQIRVQGVSPLARQPPHRHCVQCSLGEK